LTKPLAGTEVVVGVEEVVGVGVGVPVVGVGGPVVGVGGPVEGVGGPVEGAGAGETAGGGISAGFKQVVGLTGTVPELQVQDPSPL